MKKRKKWFIAFFCMILSFFFLLFASKSSFLYALNDWVDANAFFTVGKGMMNGRIPYKDLFEQKGPLLFFLHGIAYLISNKTFFGVYLLEGVFFSFFFYYSYKIMTLYLSEKKSLLLLPILAAFLFANASFKMGDSAEEFCLPFLMYSLYTFLAYFKKKKELTNKDFIINGILASCVVWIKYTMIGFWFAWMMCFFFEYVLKKEYKKAVQNCFVFLFGMFLGTLPWLLYFGFHHSLYDFFNVYILINMNSYSHQISLFQKLILPFQIFFHNLLQYPFIFWLLLIGFTFFLSSKRLWENIRGRVFFCILFFFLIFTVYIGGFGYRYYFLIFVPLILFGLIAILEYINIEIKKESLYKILLILVCGFSFFCFYQKNTNIPDMKLKKEDYAQYRFLEHIEKIEHPTLLNYGFIDGGFYLTSGIVPNVRFFEKMNFDRKVFPDNMDEQERYVKEGLVDFIVFRVKVGTNPQFLNVPHLYENYEFLDSFTQKRESKRNTYLLFRKK